VKHFFSYIIVTT